VPRVIRRARLGSQPPLPFATEDRLDDAAGFHHQLAVIEDGRGDAHARVHLVDVLERAGHVAAAIVQLVGKAQLLAQPDDAL
jgi:hypothetical protein